MRSRGLVYLLGLMFVVSLPAAAQTVINAPYAFASHGSPGLTIRTVPLFVSCRSGRSSPTLLKEVARGIHVKSVLIALTPGPLGPRTITLEDVIVSGYSFTTLPGAQDQMESVSFDFAKIQMTIDGVTSCWNIATNAGC